MSGSSKDQITKLNDNNYPVWKYKLELLLIKEDLWNIIEEELPIDADAAELAIFRKKDGKARAHIGLLIEDNQIIHVRNKHSAKEMWEALQDYHQKSTLSNKVRLLRKLCRTILPEGGNMQQHLNIMDECMDQLATLGEPIADALSVALYLSSLSESYGVLITALESRDERDLTKTMVKGKLLEEFRRRQEIEDLQNDEKALAVSNTFQVSQAFCYFCKKKGHLKANCRKFSIWKKKRDNAGTKHANTVQNNINNDEETFECLMVKDHIKVNISEWCVDSGASAHMCNNKSYFTNLKRMIHDSVILADGRNLPIEGVGIIDFRNAHNQKIRLTEVQFVPNLKCNLLSVSKLAKNGCNIVFKREKCEITKNGKTLLVVKSQNNVYKMKQEAFQVLNSNTSKCIHEWHKILGHRNLMDIRKLEAMSLGMKVDKCNHEDICEICLKCKKSRDPFPKESLTKTESKMDLIHTDVCGPLEVPTPRGNRYILTLIDDFSRYSHIYLMKQKSEVRERIIEFIEMVKTQEGKIPKVIRSDRGGEYMDAGLQNYFKSKGIKTQLTVPYTPQQNGIAERKNRTLMEMTRCMLQSSGINKHYWGEAVTTANHIINRLPTKSVQSTPYELWYGKQPSLNYFHAFGAPAYVHIPKDQRKKLDTTAKKLIFVGYEFGTKGYRLLDVDSNKIRISRDVTFINIGLNEHQTNVEIPSDTESINNEEVQQVQLSDSEGDQSSNEMILRRSARPNKGIPPKRLIAEINQVTQMLTDPTTYEEAIKGPNSQKWIEAMKEEINMLEIFGTWEITKLPPGEHAIGCKWVFKTKTDQAGNIVKYKARLVAQGFSQKFGRDYDEVFAPVANPTTLKILLTIAGKRRMTVKHFDIQAAYLNGDLSHEVYMQQPKGFSNGADGKVCKLVKNLYGLKQGAMEWNKKFNCVMQKYGYVQSNNDRCFYKKRCGNNDIYISNHVDDLVVAATDENLIAEFEKLMNKDFTLKNLGDISYYLGIHFERDDKGIFYMDQEKYIANKLHEFRLENAKDSCVPMNVGYMNAPKNEEKFESEEVYRKAIGSLLYLSTNTRPDIAVATSILARQVSDPKQHDWKEVQRVFRYLKATKSRKLKLSDDKHDETLKCYVDADWAGDQRDRKSNSGYCILFNGALISWASRKQTTVALSSTEAEFIAFSEAVKDIIWIKRLLADFEQRVDTPVQMFEDNQGCIKLLNNGTCNQRVKHIDIKYKFVQEYISKKEVTAIYCPTKTMIADMLTKPLDGSRLSQHVKAIGLL